MSSFITPLTNQRTDEYGGSLENRMRFPLEVFRAVRAVWPARKADLGAHFGQRLGRARGRDAGRTPSRSLGCCSEAGVDIIDVSAGQTSTGRAAGLRPHVPDAVLRPHPQRGRHRHAGGRQHLRARSRQFDPDGGARRSRAASRGRIWPIRTGRCTPRRGLGYDGARLAEALSGRVAINSTASSRAAEAMTGKV